MAKAVAIIRPDLAGFDEPFPPDRQGRGRRLERAISQRLRVHLIYQDASGELTRRLVRPLALLPLDKAWGLVAWCEARQDFRVFRLDRILRLTVRRDPFPDEPGRRFEDYRGWV